MAWYYWGTARETVELREAEEIRAFGSSPDGQVFIIASSPSLTIFRRTVSDYMLYSWQRKPHLAQECCLIGPALSLVGSGLFASARIGACPGIEKSTSHAWDHD